MPTIQPYESQIVGNGIENYDIKSNAAVYQGLETLGKDVLQGSEKVVDARQSIQAKKSVTQGHADMTSALVDSMGEKNSISQSFNPETTPLEQVPTFKNFTDKLKDIQSKQTDPTVAEALGKHADVLTENFAKTLYSQNAILQTKENTGAIHQQQTNLTALAFTNPDGVEDYLKMGQDFVTDLSQKHGLKGGVAEKFSDDMKQAILYRGAMGALAEDPYKAEKAMEAGKFDGLSGEKLQAVDAHIQSAIRAQERDREKEEKKALTVKEHTQLQEYHSSYGEVDDGKMSATDIQKSVMLDKITPQHADLLTKRLQSLTEGAYQGNAAMAKDADRRLRLPPTDPEAITDFNTLTAEYNGGKNMGLDKSHLDRFAKVYLAPKDADQGIKDQMGALSDAAAKSLIKPTQVPWGDKQGLAQWGKAVNYMHNDYQAKMQSGKYTSDQLLNPSSKDYIGKAVEQFQRSNSEVTQHAISSQFDSSSINADKTIAQPVGANGKFTPMPVNKSSANGAPPALSPKVQAIVDQISGRFKKKEAK